MKKELDSMKRHLFSSSQFRDYGSAVLTTGEAKQPGIDDDLTHELPIFRESDLLFIQSLGSGGFATVWQVGVPSLGFGCFSGTKEYAYKQNNKVSLQQ